MVSQNAQRYRVDRTVHNNRTLLIIAVFLWIEQILYGVVFTDPNTLIGQTHLFTSLVSFGYMILLGILYYKNKKQVIVSLWIELFQYSYIVFGLGLSVFRAIYVSSADFSIPVIYIAVLYGSAFLFYNPPLWSFILYATTSIAFIGLSDVHYEGMLYSTFVQDVIVNNLLTWIGSLIAYQRFTRQVDFVVVTEEQNIELKRLSGTDWLTKLYNRREIDENLVKLNQDAKRNGTSYSVILTDVDYFKKINDQYGHDIGDEVLIEITAIMNRIIGDQHISGRWGGEEFMVLCKNCGLKEAGEIAEKLRIAIENHKFKSDIQITCSFGVSTYENNEIVEIVKEADEALYISKENGRNMVTLKASK